MLKLYIRELCLKKGLKATQTLLMGFGISYNTAKHLLHGDVKSIKLDTLYKLCLHLDCYVEDIFVYIPEGNHMVPEGHPLRRLFRPRAPLNPPDIIKDLNPEELAKVHNFIEKMVRK